METPVWRAEHAGENVVGGVGQGLVWLGCGNLVLWGRPQGVPHQEFEQVRLHTYFTERRPPGTVSPRRPTDTPCVAASRASR